MPQLNDMLPVSEFNYSGYGAYGNVKFSGHCGSGSPLGKIGCSYFSDYIVRKLCSAIVFSLSFWNRAVTVSAAVLLYAVVNIVLLSAQEKMVRVDAFRVVASMENLKASGNISELPLKREPMAHGALPFFFDLSIATLVKASSPFPASPISKLINPSPKTINKCFVQLFDSRQCANYSAPLGVFSDCFFHCKSITLDCRTGKENHGQA